MKNIVKFWAALIIVNLPSALIAQTSPFILKGKIAPLPPSAKAYLIYNDSVDRRTDSTAIINGEFNFTGTIDQPEGVYLVINKKGAGTRSRFAQYFELYLEGNTILVSSPDSIANATVKAGSVNADNARLQIAMAKVNAGINQLNADFRRASPNQRKLKEFNDDMNKRGDSLDKEEKAVYLTFIRANPNSLLSLFALKSYAEPIPDINLEQPLFNSLSVAVRSSKRGRAYAGSIEKMKRLEIGALAPDFTQADTGGNAISLHNFSGRYVLIDFWASWCGPCRAENPNVVKAYAEYKTKGFTVIGVSLDQASGKDSWLKAIHDDHLTWTQVSDLKSWKNEVAQLYLVEAIPQNFLIGPDGKIIAKDIRGDDLLNKLKELFGN